MSLDVFVYGELVGRLSGSSRVRFTPITQRHKAPGQPCLGWAYLADDRVRDAARGQLPAWFENLLPEIGSPLRKRICAHHGLHETDSLRLLVALSHDLPGAVTLQGSVSDEEGEAIEPDDKADAVVFAGKIRFSVAGMQPKLSMMRTADRWILPGSGQGGHWYVKFAGPAFPDLPAVEAATMTWARDTGLDVPEHERILTTDVLDVDPTFMGTASEAYAVRRFDRAAGKRIHQEDFAQALEILPYDKYGGTGRLSFSYDSLARLVADACGEAALYEFIERVAFVVACGNDDAHLKNWSFQWMPGATRPRLSPCYDLVATVSWPEFGWTTSSGPELALPLGGSNAFASLNSAHVEAFARRAGAPSGRDCFVDALQRASAAWPEHAALAPEVMRTAIPQHWARVPVLRTIGLGT